MFNNKQKAFSKKETIIYTVVISLVVSLLFLWLFSGFGNLVWAPFHSIEAYIIKILGQDPTGNVWALFATQLSLSFISISVLSVLSDKDHVIYWRDLVEERLLTPRFACFAAYTYYCVSAIFVSCVAVLVPCFTLFFLSFVFNIVILVLLTDSILDVYFSKTKNCSKLLAELEHAYKAAFTGSKRLRNKDKYNKIMDDFVTQMQCHKNDSLYMRQVKDLVVNHIELFDTTNSSANQIVYSLFEAEQEVLDIRPFRAITEKAEKWAEQMQKGETNTVYIADWLFWEVAVAKWEKTQCFAEVHSHSTQINDLIELEELLRRRLAALIECEKMLVPEEQRDSFVLPGDSKSQFEWVKDRYFYLLKAIFGGYVAIYGKRLKQYYDEVNAGKTPTDINVHKYFPGRENIEFSQLVAVIEKYNDINAYLEKYGNDVKERFLSLAK